MTKSLHVVLNVLNTTLIINLAVARWSCDYVTVETRLRPKHGLLIQKLKKKITDVTSPLC